MTSARFQADFTGRVICVSGGATSIGAATACMSAAAGAQVVIADVDLAAAGATVAAITADGVRARAVHCDVGAEVQVDELMAGIMAQEGRLDVVHANAGLESVQKATDASVQHWERVLNVNLTGVFLVCRAALRHMYQRGAGSVVITSSPHATAAVPDAAAYAASKGGVYALMHALALKAAPHGVRVNGVNPGVIDTPMVRREILTAAKPEAQLSKLAASYPLGRLGQSWEVAAVVLFLASEAASFITGSAIPVDGGLMAALPSGPAPAYSG